MVFNVVFVFVSSLRFQLSVLLSICDEFIF